jgi:hypothetical protein
MIISDLEILEVVEVANVQGGIVPRTYTQTDNVTVNFFSNNNFATAVNSPTTASNSAAAGAKGDAQRPTTGLISLIPTYSYTKADTIAATQFLGDSFSASTSVAVINSAI